MKKKLVALLLLCNGIMFSSLHSQDLAFDKIIYSFGENSASAKAMCTDTLGNVYVAGNFSGKTLFEHKSLTAKGKSDAFLAKYDKDHKLVWLKQIKGYAYNYAHSVTTDSKSNVYICGSFGRTCDFDGEEIKSSDYRDNFIAKYSPEAELIWLKHIKADTKGEQTILAVDKNDHLYYAGSFYKSIRLGTNTLKAQNNSDIFISEWDKEGSFVKATHIKGQNAEKINDLVFDNDHNMYLTGSFITDIEFNASTIKSKGQEDIFIAKYTDLKLEWLRTAGGEYRDYGKKIKIIGNTILLGGSFSSEITFEDKELVSSGALDAFVCAYNSKGDVKWLSQFGNRANEYLNAIETNQKGQIYLSGNFKGTIQNKGNRIKSDGLINDIFLAKISEEGEFIWAKNYGDKGSDYGVSLVMAKDNYLYLTGDFENKITFDEETTKLSEGNNFFISRFYDCYDNKKIDLGKDTSACGTEYMLKAENGFVSYQWSNGATGQTCLVDSEGTYSVIATDSLGCKSENEIAVRLNPIPVFLTPDTSSLCNESSVRLDAGAEFESYLWNTGSDKQKITAVNAGEYIVEVSNEFGCSNTATFIVKDVQVPEFTIGKQHRVLKGEKLILSPGMDFKSYLWSDYTINATLVINSADLEIGIYDFWLEVQDEFNCLYGDNTQVEVLEKGIEDISLLNIRAKIHPNPSNGQFWLDLEDIPKNQKIEYKVYSVNGILLKSFTNQISTKKNFQREIDLQFLAKGSYFLNIEIGEKVISKEFIIQ